MSVVWLGLLYERTQNKRNVDSVQCILGQKTSLEHFGNIVGSELLEIVSSYQGQLSPRDIIFMYMCSTNFDSKETVYYKAYVNPRRFWRQCRIGMNYKKYRLLMKAIYHLGISYIYVTQAIWYYWKSYMYKMTETLQISGQCIVRYMLSLEGFGDNVGSE